MKFALSILAIGLVAFNVQAQTVSSDDDSSDTDSTTSMSSQSPSQIDDDEEDGAAPAAPVTDDPAPRAERLAPQPPAPDREASAPVPPPPAPAPAPGAEPLREARPEVAGDLRAPSPKVFDENRRGYFQLGVGPAYGAALVSDSLMYNVVGSYNLNTSDRLTVKALADLYMASGSVSSRLYDFGVGAEYFIPEIASNSTMPYAAADVGVGFARNAKDETATAVNLGAGAGFKFQVRELNCDINAHYAQLTANVGPSAPAIFALRGNVQF